LAKTRKANKPNQRSRKKKRKWLLPLIGLVFVGLVAAIFYGLMNRPSIDATATIPTKNNKPPEFDKLIGSWVRPDGGYIIEINKIYPDGRVDAAYFNPRPIQVSRSTVSAKDQQIELFVELQGKGYPGSTYTLKYNPDYDAMVGIYFQAVIQQPFDVIFQRK
jgi:hypothetical protein